MIAWIALFVSVIGLFINIIVQREKLSTAIEEFRKWKQQQNERKKASEAVKKLLV